MTDKQKIHSAYLKQQFEAGKLSSIRAGDST
jgi:hypothetical protein